jgi:hypothetical protein
MQEKQIVSPTRTSEERAQESTIGENVDCRPEFVESDVGEDAQAATYSDGTISKFTYRTDGDVKSGNEASDFEVK